MSIPRRVAAPDPINLPAPRVLRPRREITLEALLVRLCLDENREYDPRRQRALARYYVDAGSGGIAIGVHTTQFEIREAGLYERVLETVAETMDNWTDRPLIRIAGLVGKTAQMEEIDRVYADYPHLNDDAFVAENLERWLGR